MIRPVVFAALIVVAVAGAAALRLADLGNRPMHCDEANHAIKFGGLLERDDYVYDPHEYHGPDLYYLTLPIAWAVSAEKLTQITETHLRLLTAAFGILLVGLVWLLREDLGRTAAWFAAALTAISPAMVFYSRYYVQEMLLVCFSFAAFIALWRFAREVGPDASEEGRLRLRRGFWLVTLGLCVGMMHASKETCVIALFAMGVAAACTCPGLRRMGLKRTLISALIVLVPAAILSMLFFSSFLKNPPGVIDSVTTYFHYLGRASGEGSAGRHDNPWHYYFRVLFWHQRYDGRAWTEVSLAALALVGMLAGAIGKGLGAANRAFVLFLSIYTLLMMAVYTAFPYKTPWCALGFLHGLILLAGVGASVLIWAVPNCCTNALKVLPRRIGESVVAGGIVRWSVRLLMIVVVLAAAGHLGWQAYLASFVEYEEHDNPYVYAHSTSDMPRLAQRIREIVAAVPVGTAGYVEVVCIDGDFWPLPWYMRDFRRVGWFEGVPVKTPAPLVAVIDPKFEPALFKKVFELLPEDDRHLYVALLKEQNGRNDWRIRPPVSLRAYVRQDLWDAYAAQQAEQVLPGGE